MTALILWLLSVVPAVKKNMPAKKRQAASNSKQPDKQTPSEKVAKLTEDNPTTYSSASLIDTLTDPGWKRLLSPLFRSESWKKLTSLLDDRLASGEVIYPPIQNTFKAFNLTPLDQVKVVILGQDPYHGPGQADGLAFSFSGPPDNLPPSLRNIIKVLHADVKGFKPGTGGSLEKWARQGVLLLNTALTVAAGKPGSHSKLGWADFTDSALSALASQSPRPIVFLLWGKPAQAKAKLVTSSMGHVILTAAHPSPAACGAFNGCGHFSKANAALESSGLRGIDWSLE